MGQVEGRSGGDEDVTCRLALRQGSREVAFRCQHLPFQPVGEGDLATWQSSERLIIGGQMLLDRRGVRTHGGGVTADSS